MTPSPPPRAEMEVGALVRKIGGDYSFDGMIVSTFRKRSGEVRVVVEDDRGVLFIFRPSQLEARAEMGGP